jgi:adenosylmethionine-8-amino-7-oxononanoate aminotransferase
MKRLEELLEFDIVGDVRGIGLLLGFEFVKDKETKEPFDPSLNVAVRYQDEALKRGLIQYACTGSVDGVAGDMVLVTPPLIITREQVDDMVAIMKDTLVVLQREIVNA